MAIKGKGATFTYNAGAVGNVRSVGWSGYTWDTEDTTTVEQASDIKTFLKTVADGGEITLTIQFATTLYNTLIGLANAYGDDSTSKAWVLAVPQSGLTGTQFSGNGRIVRLGSPTFEVGNVAEFELVVKVDGEVTFAAGT